MQLTREAPDDRTEDAAPAAARREVGARCLGVGQAELDGPLDRRRHGDAEALDPQRPDDPLLDAMSVTALQLVRNLAEAGVADTVRAEPDGEACGERCGGVGVHAHK